MVDGRWTGQGKRQKNQRLQVLETTINGGWKVGRGKRQKTRDWMETILKPGWNEVNSEDQRTKFTCYVLDNIISFTMQYRFYKNVQREEKNLK
mmetsp:Transcript_32948/g.52740  ORF Transcript_32948/g.52740 Transcript_32948/m.52740 type:complete len:93 (+) Transcript_32948:6-284(+)